MVVGLVLEVLNSSIFHLFLVACLLVLIYDWTFSSKLYPGFPAVGIDPRKGFLRGFEKARDDWYLHGKEILDRGLKTCVGCFQVVTDAGPKIIMPNRFADEIRNHPDLNFCKAISKEFFGSYPGFKPFADGIESQIVLEVVRGRLTQSLNLITEELADETSQAVKELFGKPDRWTEITYKPMLLQLVARVSARVFVGPELCTNEDWLHITKEYTIEAFIAGRALRTWNPLLRPVVHWFLPECRTLRWRQAEARRIAMPIIEERRKANRLAKEEGQPTLKTADTIGWMDEAARGRQYDVVNAQLSLSFAAIHTTSEMVTGLMSDLCANPENFESLREEITSVLGGKGWTKQALHNLKLMDSVMKESQRHHFGDIAAMYRIAEKALSLSDGTRIPEGAFTMVGIDRMHDLEVFNDPHSFNGSRFLDMRQQPGDENRWQFVTTSPEHLAFGHGKHACPGRFFASNEIKTVLIYLLMEYDWKFTYEGPSEDLQYGQELSTDPNARVMIRKREVPITLQL
ncbi:hypothetical protein ABOM_001453 [Aspergillus bombycis]|uniref:Cytochrome P450 n=1 Tax=Aspergillus bombycis TaxID=109264 RepID=A0A1F8ADN5_9EURO|nr:hypothetical protein ABOM_001453 [Aspergillus bombycis]OGM49856.1 hypothetical protein ABOM_001453 [Aspergillus bombycis]